MNYTDSPHGNNGITYRPPHIGSKGAVVANHPLAAQAGMKTLNRGGNAVDAMISVAFSLGVAEPSGSSIGGDGFVMIHMNKKNSIEVANGTGAAPYAATATKYSNGIPYFGMKSTSTPGMLDALLKTHEKHGTLSLRECIDPAIELCEEGVPTTHFQAEDIKKIKALIEFPTSSEVFAPNGKWLKAGEKRRNLNLAKTYQRIIDGGRDEFYLGETAKKIVQFSEDTGGLLSLNDLSKHTMIWQKPISTNYRGKEVYEAPPNSSGHVLLQELNILENFDLQSYNYLSPESLHLMVEAKKLSFADREAFLADPEFIDVPIEGLLSKKYSKERSYLISLEKAIEKPKEGDPWNYMKRHPEKNKKYRFNKRLHLPGGDTTHYCIVDQWGNSISGLQSIQTAYGSGIIAGDTGILMNNRMTYWHLDPEHIDFLNPGQRVRHTMNPVMVFSNQIEKGGVVELVCGTPGADTQVQTNLQIITSIYDYELNVSEAIEGPRWTHYQGKTNSAYPHKEENFLEIENRISKETFENMRNKGHKTVSSGGFGGAGCAGAIQIYGKEKTLFASSDLRKDGYSSVW